MVTKLIALLGAGLLAAPLAANASTVYYVDQVFGTSSLTGTISTDGVVGVVAVSDIVDWNLRYNAGNGTQILTGPLSGNDSGLIFQNHGPTTDLTATSSELLFNFNDQNDEFASFQSDASLSSFVQFGSLGVFGSGIVLGDASAPNGFVTIPPDSDLIGSVKPVPVPAAAWLLVSGLVGLGAMARKRQT